MKIDEIMNSISTLPGVGPATAKQFANLNVFTVGDLLRFYPRDWEDRTRRIPLSQFQNAPKVHTVARITGQDWFGYGKMRTLKLLITDGTAQAELICFNRSFLEKSMPVNTIIAVTGRFEVKYGHLQSTAFDIEKIAPDGSLEDFASSPVPNSRIFPVYSLTEGLNQKTVLKVMSAALRQYGKGIDDEVPPDIQKQYGLIPKAQAIRQIHLPESIAEVNQARHTLAFEELYQFQRVIVQRAWEHRGIIPSEQLVPISSSEPETAAHSKSPAVTDADFNRSLSPRQSRLLSVLPFELTPDQKEAVFRMNSEIDRTYESNQTAQSHPYAMRTLLQGDVGSGKTLTAFFACLRVIDYGSQCAFMAPTEILARQHAENAAKLLESLNVSVAYLTGNLKAAGRSNLISALKDGSINLVIGTHALFSRDVQYHDLALAVIDEQHRFGVMQRSAIIDKGRLSVEPKTKEPSLLMMSATPIPQTLALTAFGDLDVLTIHTMPQGRKPVITYLSKAGNERNAYEAVRKELMKGHQAYFVYPAIEKNDSGDGNTDSGSYSSTGKGDSLSPAQSTTGHGAATKAPPLKSAEEMFTFLSEEVYPGFTCALIHGKISDDEQSRILSDFKENKIQILVATTVVEVGVDVPNATCIVIEQADRFGLAELHQLRGRTGRGKEQSYCFLIYRTEITENGIARMKVLHETTDGFKIAEEDLILRGPGEITGTAQSGELTFALADLARDKQLLIQARAAAIENLKKSQTL